MDIETKTSLDIRQERFGLQAHFLTPVFNLLQDLPAFSHQLFGALGSHYNLRLTNLRLETGAGSFGETFLRLSWPSLAEVRIFLDRVEIDSSYLNFLRFENRDLVADVLNAVAEYVPDTRFRAYSVTQEAHGNLIGQSREEFLTRFAPSIPEGLGPALGAGMVFYFGAESNHMASSVILDFSREVEGGIFVRSVVLYDASRVPAGDLRTEARSDFEFLFNQIGLAG